jgi:hypothetical protein
VVKTCSALRQASLSLSRVTRGAYPSVCHRGQQLINVSEKWKNISCGMVKGGIEIEILEAVIQSLDGIPSSMTHCESYLCNINVFVVILDRSRARGWTCAS